MTMTMTIKVEEATAAGDWGYAKGTYVQTITPKAGGPVTSVDGKWLDILKRQPDGTWRLYIDCFNSNVPPK
jgi:ketosteroid isomerase-like protein